ncbi:U-box domain-containing protein 5-like isoform X2 [Senna tora]|uniref:U-box domain-containing protein 5-like isoform X2 n=1 Tax=Senna tora TaxID=362788 RepID=A0A834WBV4_9FABA|nr:U-box domain-containing protein 5-like isoform X2 [Senna tora]
MPLHYNPSDSASLHFQFSASMPNTVVKALEVSPPISKPKPKVHHSICFELEKFIERISHILLAAEAARPNCALAIQALCSLHFTLDKAKLVIQQCSESSRLYLVIKAHKIISRCKRIRSDLELFLTQIQKVVPVLLVDEISGILHDLGGAEFGLDFAEEEARKAILELLEKNLPGSESMNNAELDAIEIATMRLRITCPLAVVEEKAALKKVIGTDKREKELVKYLIRKPSMEQKRQPFRFRIPWISAASVAESSSRRPKKEPFRPAGIATASPSTTQTRLKSSLPSPSDSSSTQSQHKMKSPPKTIPKSHHHNPPPRTPSQPQNILKAPYSDTKKLETDTNGGSSKTGQQIGRTKAERHATTTQITRAEQKKQEGAETKMMFATSNPTGQDIKVNVSSMDPGTSNVSSMSPQKPPLPNAQKEIRQGISNYVDKLSARNTTQVMDDEDPFRVVTLAGDNRGAIMNIGSDGKKERSIHIHRAYKKNPEDRPGEVNIDGEESSEEESNDPAKKDDEEVRNVYVNSNTQSINNSFMFQSWVKERDPGVEFILPQQPEERGVRCVETKKREINVCRNDGLNKQPRIRRRCLRGLLAETSESDPDKPPRHGCKFKCGNTDLEGN